MSGLVFSPFGNVPDLRHKVRRLNWFRRSLADAAARIGRQYGIRYIVDDRELLFAFFAWASRFEVDRKKSSRNRRDFAIYSGGIMLFELLTAKPVRYTLVENETQIQPEALTDIARFWPDGFLYTNYCLSIVNMILEQDFNAHSEPPPQFQELRFWQSFRENFRADPGLAVAFFDVFMSVEPNWSFPESFLKRPAVSKEAALASTNSGEHLGQ